VSGSDDFLASRASDLVMIDLTPSAERMIELLEGVPDDRLGASTPCPDLSVGDLIDHVGSLSVAFTAKTGSSGAGTGPPPAPSAANLGPDWRQRIPADVRALAAVWKEPGAWEGMTTAGGIELPRQVAGLIALDELIVHGWDLAVATGQSFDARDDDVEAAISAVKSFEAPRDGRLFGPTVDIPTSGSPLDRLLGLTGRNPSWSDQAANPPA
jgi:uncharacterized protein (TIGR03086 family)